jgi:hypothetical protein
MAAGEGEKGRSKVKLDEFTAKVVPDPKNPTDALLLTGFLGASSEAGQTRIYWDASLSSFVDMDTADILHTEPLPKDQSPLGGAYIWVKRSAEVSVGGSAGRSAKGKFFEGPLMTAYGGAFAAAAALGATGLTPGAAALLTVGRCHTALVVCRPSVVAPCVTVWCYPTELGPCASPGCPPVAAGPAVEAASLCRCQGSVVAEVGALLTLHCPPTWYCPPPTVGCYSWFCSPLPVCAVASPGCPPVAPGTPVVGQVGGAAAAVTPQAIFGRTFYQQCHSPGAGCTGNASCLVCTYHPACGCSITPHFQAGAGAAAAPHFAVLTATFCCHTLGPCGWDA